MTHAASVERTDAPASPTFGNATALLEELDRLEDLVSAWESPYGTTALAYRRASDRVNAEAFRRLIARLRANPSAFGALKDALQDEVVYSVLRHHELVKPSLQERIEEALDGVRPMLALHGGDVQLVRVILPAAIEVRFTGACESCPASVTTFTLGVKKALEAQCPEITDVRQVKGLSAAPTSGVRFVSPFAAHALDGWLAAGTLAEIPEDGVRHTTVDGEAVILTRAGGAIACYQNACAHLGFPLDGALVVDGTLVCPHHGFAYELASGECLTARGVQLRTHAVRVTGDDVHVRLSR
jgi:nitrite reductase/ring-hydroxylating ferredoxin subunit/Fe-S cluster biogenesis protein NfuA